MLNLPLHEGDIIVHVQYPGGFFGRYYSSVSWWLVTIAGLHIHVTKGLYVKTVQYLFLCVHAIENLAIAI